MTDETTERNSRSTRTMGILVALAVVAAAIVFFLYFRAAPEPVETEEVATSMPVPQDVPVVADEERAPRDVYEAPEPEATAEPLPPLGESDANVLSSLQGLSTQTLKYAVPEEILRKVVRAVNAIEEGKVVHEYRPIVSPAPGFIAESAAPATAERPEQFRLSPENYQRYDDYVTLLAMLDADALAAFYHRFYPLLEEAYAEMGLKKGNFHSIFIGAIDEILSAPVVEGDLALIRPGVFYKYADPELEKLPPYRKLLLRMGPENTRSLQTSLRALRAKISE